MSKVLVFGAGGQLGQALQAETLPPGWELRSVARAECDITDHRGVQAMIENVKPDLVINTAAMTNVDQCEKDRKLAERINFEAPANMAAQCAVRDLPLIHISTDYVFDGHERTPYTEESKMNPLSVYGDTKMVGDMAVQHELAWHVILRPSSAFGPHGVNILTRGLAILAKNNEVKFVDDQLTCPTYTPDLAKAVLKIGSEILRGTHGCFGTFHYCGEGPASRYEFTQALMEAYAPFTSHRPKILPAKSSDFPGFAERPHYSVMDCGKIRRVFGISQKPWREGVPAAITILKQQGKLP